MGLKGEQRAARDVPGPYGIGHAHWPGLGKLAEECGELLQVVGKLIGTSGDPNHWDGSNLRDRLGDELGDVLAAIKFVIKTNGLDMERIMGRSIIKFDQLQEWHEAAPVEGTDAKDAG